MREEMGNPETKTGAGRKVLAVFGVILIAVGVFLGSFACSFQVMIESAKTSNLDEETLEGENARLKENVHMLEEKIEILETELQQKKGEDETDSTASPSSTAKATSTSGYSKSTSKPSSTKSTSKSSSSGTEKPKTTSSATTTSKPAKTSSSTSGSAATSKPAGTSKPAATDAAELEF